MANGPHKIVVKLDVDTGCHTVSETTTFTVDATCVSDVKVASGSRVTIHPMPTGNTQKPPEFLLVQPYSLGGKAIPAGLLLGAAQAGTDWKKGFRVPVPPTPQDKPDTKTEIFWYGTVEYSTDVDHDTDPRPKGDGQRKPLQATHAFFAGQTEWVTDMVKDGGPGALKHLVFWNNLKAYKIVVTKKPDGTEILPETPPVDSELKGDDLAIKIQIVVGHNPLHGQVKPY